MDPAINNSWPDNTDFAELRVIRHSGVSSAKRCLVAGAADVDMTAASGRAKMVGQWVFKLLKLCLHQSGSVRGCYRRMEMVLVRMRLTGHGLRDAPFPVQAKRDWAAGG